MAEFVIGLLMGVALSAAIVSSFGDGTGVSTFTACKEKGYVVFNGVPYKCHFEEMKP